MDPYADWDAAYLLGSLSASERREFEQHLEGCASCAAAVGELAGMPGLLAKVPAGEASVLLSDESNEVPATLLPRLVRATRRRRARVITLAGLATAAALAAVLIVPQLIPTAAPQAPSAEPASSTVSLSQVAPGPLRASIRLVPQSWGTRIEMDCKYGPAEPTGYGATGAQAYYAMWVTDAAGHATQIATWTAGPGHNAEPAGTTSLSVAQIAAVDVRSVESGEVLLRGTP
ncbi:MAG TPA: zf-HC2 domain-containing protein [Lacisediminihabitans sp.]|nr:zf-HC2 domain-containing protein [Lacisediminihabitans sp.]HXD61063.1 zf-HC2 domain-containing protein [Lacisediminihabitans sp.]